jgi:hypothetical protein
MIKKTDLFEFSLHQHGKRQNGSFKLVHKSEDADFRNS